MNNLSKTYELLNLSDIFAAGNRQLSVPDYQRGYSWEYEQRIDLINDIKQIVSKDHRHFTGTVVASQNNENSVYDLVDGQQRITSLVILISCLLRASKAQGLDSLAGDGLQSIEAIYIRSGFETGNSCYQLQLGVVRDPLFREVLADGHSKNQTIKNKADQNIVDAAKQFSNFLDGLDQQHLDDVYRTVTQKLGFLLYAPKQDAEIGIMFEVINNRGKPLSELEKIKNYLIYFAGRNEISDLKKKVNDSWPVLLESLNTAGFTSNDDEDRFLRVCWLVFKDTNKSKSYHVYDNLKREYSPSNKAVWRELARFVDFITSAAKTYAALFHSGSSNLLAEEKVFLERIALHPAQASILPLVVALYSKESEAEKRLPILDLLEKLNFRYYITGIANRNDSGQGELFDLAYDFYNDSFDSKEKSSKLSNVDFLNEKLVKFIGREANDLSFVKHLTLDEDEAGDYYKWQGLKYFLGSYEDHLLKVKRKGSQLARFLASRDKVSPNDFYHREHIWAVKELSVLNDAHDLNINKRRLGNFILLMETINIKVGKKRIEEKVKEYFDDTDKEPNTHMIRELKADFEKATKYVDDSKEFKRQVKNYWFSIYQKFLDIREQRMINFALNRWRVEGIKRSVIEVQIDSKNFEGNEVFMCTHAEPELDNFAGKV